MRLIARTLGTFALALTLLCGVVHDAGAGTDPVEPPLPTVLPAEAAEAEKLLGAAEKALSDKDDTLLANVLHDMRGHSHDDFVPVIKKALGSKNILVLEKAVLAAASHEMESEAKRVAKIFKTSSKTAAKKKKKKKKGSGVSGNTGTLAAACVEYFAVLAIEGHEKSVLEDNLKKIFASETFMKSKWAGDMVRSSILYLGRMKWTPAVPQLVFMLREPVPENPNAADNPPASYWEARYTLWHESEGWIRWALKEITGHEFRTYREWNAWVTANKKQFD